jgi:hypothetical protein
LSKANGRVEAKLRELTTLAAAHQREYQQQIDAFSKVQSSQVVTNNPHSFMLVTNVTGMDGCMDAWMHG